MIELKEMWKDTKLRYHQIRLCSQNLVQVRGCHVLGLRTQAHLSLMCNPPFGYSLSLMDSKGQDRKILLPGQPQQPCTYVQCPVLQPD